MPYISPKALESTEDAYLARTNSSLSLKGNRGSDLQRHTQ
jgi:hypothetical protein